MGNRILYTPVKREEVTKGGIILSQVRQESLHTLPIEGTVVAIGPKVLDVQVGDIVLVQKNAGTPVKIDGADSYVLPEDEVLGIM